MTAVVVQFPPLASRPAFDAALCRMLTAASEALVEASPDLSPVLAVAEANHVRRMQPREAAETPR